MPTRRSLREVAVWLVVLTLAGCESPSGPKPASDDEPGSDDDSSPSEEGCDDPSTWYADRDGDGYGDNWERTTACEAPDGYVSRGGDCNVEDAEINPGQDEQPYNGRNDDCDRETPDDDLDGDWEDAAETGGSDCDDSDPDIGTNAEDEIDEAGLDTNCDGMDGTDGDGDGVVSVASGGEDCDDDDAQVFPGASEDCGDGKVNDCAGDVDSAVAACGLSGEQNLSDAHVVIGGNDDDNVNINTVAPAGDVDGDGQADLLVGVSWSTGLVLGATMMSDPSLYEWDLIYLTYSNAMAGAADLDGDGLDDLLIGDSYRMVESGVVYLYLGEDLEHFAEHDDTLRLTGEVSDDGAGYAVAWTGDMDGGGSPELLIGAPFESSGADGAGAAYLVYGETALAERSSMVLSGADLKLVGEANLDYSGIALTGAGDVDGDGLADVAISSYYNDSGGDTAGAVYVVLGATAAVAASPLSLSDADLQLLGESSGDMAGLSLAGPGDVDGDGLDDLLLAAPYENTGGDAAGAVYLAHGATLAGLSGPTDLSSVDLKFIGESSGAMAGWSLAGPGDVDADGLMDLFIGSPEGDDDGDDDAGAAYLVSGAAAAAAAGTQDLAVATLKLTGEHYDDNAGSSVAGAGDVNADGYADLAITAPSASYAGLGYVVLAGGY